MRLDPKSQVDRACEAFLECCMDRETTLKESIEENLITEEFLKENEYKLRQISCTKNVPIEHLKERLLSKEL